MSSNIPSPDACQGEFIEKLLSNSMQIPEVTVVTVCFNPLKEGRRALFARSLDSVQQQSGVSLEHLIVDGASTDGTIEFLRAYRNTKHDIRILSMADSGIYQAMNRGIALARGKYIIFLNSDDYYHRADGLSVSVKALEKSACSFTFAPVRPEGAKRFHTHYHHPQRRLHKFFLTCIIPHPSMLYRKSALVEVGGYNQNYRLAADYDLTLRLIAAGYKARFVSTCFATFAMGGFSTQSQNAELAERENALIVKSIHNKVFGVKFTEQETRRVLRGTYPRQFLPVYKASQKIIAGAFEGLPRNIVYKALRCFNYIKYYLKCLFSSPDNA